MDRQTLEKLKNLQERLIQKHKQILRAPTDQLVYLRDKLKLYVDEVARIVDKCLVVNNSDGQMVKFRKQLQVAKNQLQRLSKKKQQSQPQGWFKTILMAIPRLIWWTLINILKSLAFICSVGYLNYFKQQEKSEYDIQAEIQKWTGVKNHIEESMRQLPSSKQLHIKQIIEFIQKKGPQIEQFVRELERTYG